MPTLTTNAAQIAREFAEMEHRAEHRLPAHQVVGQLLRNAVLRNFRQGGHFPRRWPVSRRAAATGGKTLIDRAILRNSYHAEATDDYAAVGTDVVYAAIHEYGGRCGRNHATVLPPRPMLPVDGQGNLEPALARRVVAVLETWIVEGRA